MLTRKKPEVLLAALTLKGQGETVKFNITFHNRKQSELNATLTAAATRQEGVTETILFIVKDWDAEYPLTSEGIKEAEDDRPGIIMAVIECFHATRQVEKEKN